MQELLVLGLIPGTNIQITFVAWLLLVCALGAWILATIAHRRHLVTIMLVTAIIMQQTRIRQPQA
jgi:hypothetical protein